MPNRNIIFLSILLICMIDASPLQAALANQVPQPAAETVQAAGGNSDLTLFFGRFHPVLVHLPIGFLLMAFLLEFVSLIKRYEQLAHAVPFVLLMGIIAGLFSAITGWLLSEGGGYGEDLLWLHKWLGISVVVLSIAAWLIRVVLYDDPRYKRIFRILLCVMVAAVTAAGHYGGSLTHGADYLFRYMPEPARSWMSIEEEEPGQVAFIENLETAMVYNDVIEPIFKARCQSCHDTDRTEGNLLMTSYENLMAGGDSGSVIDSYNTTNSELYRRLHLADRDKERMPPRGRTQLTPGQIQLIGWWIEQGAPSGQLVSELETSAEIQWILESLTPEGRPFYERVNVEYAETELVERARAAGFYISPIAEGMAFLQVRAAASKTKITADDIGVLLPLAEQITWLDISRREVSDEDLSRISEFRNLTRLHLQQTEITDHTLSFLGSLRYLEYLNLYGTRVSDDGLVYITPLRQLTSIYLWQTDVTPEGAEQLVVGNSRLAVFMGNEQMN